VADRPVRLDLAWRSIEPNTFGLDEFMTWTKKAGVEPMLAVNLGTRGVADALNLLEYANFQSGTRYSDLRSSHGHRAPYGVKLWCLGNEMDGPWQVGHKTAEEYGRLAAETAKAMKLVDPTVELVACGSSNDHMPTFGSWEATVLEHAYDYVDYLSLHAYFEQQGDDRTGFLASAVAMDRFIDAVAATCDYVAAKKRIRRKLKLSFDEWNIWSESRFVGQTNLDWERAPRLIEDEYTAEDAVVVGNLLMSLLRHSDRIAVACLAQLVNVIAPIRAEERGEAWRQTIYYPFALTAKRARGEVLRIEPITETLHSTALGDVPVVDVVVTHDAASDTFSVFAVNRSETDVALLVLDVIDGNGYRVADHLVIGGADLQAANSQDAPLRCVPQSGQKPTIDGRNITLSLPPVSWSTLTLRKENSGNSLTHPIQSLST
jgi:alpha-N-arabinofuranosidase